MKYPKSINKDLVEQIALYSVLKYESGSKEIDQITEEIDSYLTKMLKKVSGLKTDTEFDKQNPDPLPEIKKLRPQGPRKMVSKLDESVYLDKLEGALLSRLAGCILGAPVEFWSTKKMQELSKETNFPFPPDDYWPYVHEPYRPRYEKSVVEEYTRDKMDGVPVDDDIIYTILGLIIAEEHGLDFTVENVAASWLKYLPFACTAEEVVLASLKKDVNPLEVAEINNPYTEWIGASIRADPWGYIAPGLPELAAKMAYKDAYLTHRKQGTYAEMYFAAAIAAAFVVDNPVDALKIGLSEIPENSWFAKEIHWSLEASKDIHNYQDARDAITERFDKMSHAHSINNACLTVFGLTIGGTDMTKVISETVAMGYDNDCTAATAGSIVGAIVGKKGIPGKWYKNFNNKVYTYLNGIKAVKIDELVSRFYQQAQNVFKNI